LVVGKCPKNRFQKEKKKEEEKRKRKKEKEKMKSGMNLGMLGRVGCTDKVCK